MVTDIERDEQRQMDEEILYYSREMNERAPVTVASIAGFLTRTRRRKISERDVLDRLHYLTSAGYLKEKRDWEGGEVVTYEITANGMDLMDGRLPPRGWKG